MGDRLVPQELCIYVRKGVLSMRDILACLKHAQDDIDLDGVDALLASTK
jgi:hypothetical protein